MSSKITGYAIESTRGRHIREQHNYAGDSGTALDQLRAAATHLGYNGAFTYQCDDGRILAYETREARDADDGSGTDTIILVARPVYDTDEDRFAGE